MARIYSESSGSNALPIPNMIFQTSLADVALKDRMKIAGTGDISFYEDTGTTAKLFWDASAESLGIGTTTPNYLLDIESSGALFRINATSGDATAQLSVADTTSLNTINFGDSGSTTAGQILYRHNGDSMAFNVAGAEAVRILNGGNVGIGTSSPAAKLHVYQSANNIIQVGSAGTSTAGIDLAGDGATAGTDSYRLYQDSGKTAYVWNYANTPLRIGTNNTEAIRVDASQNVGIGTSSPSEKLHVAGALRIANNSADTYLGYGSNSDNYISTASGGATIFRELSTERMRIDSSGNLLVGVTSNAPTTTAGINLGANNKLHATRNGGTSGYFNRLTSDGGIVEFAKDGTTVGSIGNNTDFYIASQDGVGLRFTSTQVLPCSESGAIQNGSRDLGSSSGRFKDLYLSGGAYLLAQVQPTSWMTMKLAHLLL